MAAAAIGLNLLRAIRRPALRKTVIAALVIAAACAAVGTLTDRTSLCRVGDLVQGHAVWHVLAVAALWRLASVRIAAVSALVPVSRRCSRLRRRHQLTGNACLLHSGHLASEN